MSSVTATVATLAEDASNVHLDTPATLYQLADVTLALHMTAIPSEPKEFLPAVVANASAMLSGHVVINALLVPSS